MNIQIDAKKASRNGVVMIVVRDDHGTIAAENVSLLRPDARAALVRRILEARPDEDSGALESKLLNVAAELAETIKRDAETAGDGGKQASMIIDVVKGTGVELFHDPDRNAFARVPINDHVETFRIYDRPFKLWTRGLYYRKFGSTPNTQSLSDALAQIEGMAVYDGSTQETRIRVGGDGVDEIWIDLGSDDWSAVHVEKSGWRIVPSSDCPVKFRRVRGIRPLPIPSRGGSANDLRRFVNIGDDPQWALLVSWLVAALRPTGPYPILAVHGQQGTAKSTLCRFARMFIDPSGTPLRRPPKDERDLMIAAGNSWIVAYDNLSGISPSLSDSLCVLATGGGFATRELHTDDNEKLFSAMRPCIINGIDDLATRGDLADRTINLMLPVITETERRDERSLMLELNAAAPGIFGALLDSLSAALRNHESVYLDRLPRMADFAKFAVAAETANGITDGAFMAAYSENREDASRLAVESNPIGPALLSMMSDRPNRWLGTASELLNILGDARHSTDADRRSKTWPTTAKGVASMARRIAPSLKSEGLCIEFSGPSGHDKRRIITIEHIPVTPSAQSASPAYPLTEDSTGNTHQPADHADVADHIADDSANTVDIDPDDLDYQAALDILNDGSPA